MAALVLNSHRALGDFVDLLGDLHQSLELLQPPRGRVVFHQWGRVSSDRQLTNRLEHTQIGFSHTQFGNEETAWPTARRDIAMPGDSQLCLVVKALSASSLTSPYALSDS